MSSIMSSSISSLSSADITQAQALLNLVQQYSSNPDLLQALVQAAQTSPTSTSSSPSSPPLGKRARFTEEQKQRLENLFKENPLPSKAQKEAIVEKTGLTYDQVTRWVQNQRYRLKRGYVSFGSNGDSQLSTKKTRSEDSPSSSVSSSTVSLTPSTEASSQAALDCSLSDSADSDSESAESFDEVL
ncbi:hypothetical protein L596_028544 [Steinernema carpocapsae]|uniref:Homeobox domain-containing protein n=1 Tax=Steinernema carpocapsae TaxID=34508 RepID=A0A4U5LYQ6_STECR|nr:hypothetical protein L596_028544 [Steinernema carpocapsae]